MGSLAKASSVHDFEGVEGKILAGTASWTDPGFVAEWYPADLPASHRLRWYADHFPIVEVNSTFYRIPEAKVTKRWCKETPPSFVFDAKLHRYLSRHSTPPALLPPNLRPKAVLKGKRVELTPALERAVTKAFLKGLQPFEESGKLGALLLQLSPAFSPRHNKLPELDGLLELLEGKRVAVELRNGGWTTSEIFAETKKFFVRRKIAFVMVDAPDDPHFTILPSLDLVTTPKLAYLRAHGRNVSGYIRGRSVPERFDYVYSKIELEQIAERAAKASAQAREVHVIYNNNKADYAPRAAAQFQQIIRSEHPELMPEFAAQRELTHVTV